MFRMIMLNSQHRSRQDLLSWRTFACRRANLPSAACVYLGTLMVQSPIPCKDLLYFGPKKTNAAHLLNGDRLTMHLRTIFIMEHILINYIPVSCFIPTMSTG